MDALAGLRVLELGGEIAAGYATKLLGDLGADVIKLEPPTGDPLRTWDPTTGVDESGGDSGLFRYLNGGKQSLVVDLDDEAGRATLLDAARTADVVVESLGAGALESLGVGPEQLAAASPTLALVRISDFGQHGPYVGTPTTGLTIQALGGLVTSRGVPQRDPVQVGGRIHEYTAGSYAAAAALTAARAARTRRELVVADLSVMECLVLGHPYFMILMEDMVSAGKSAPQDRHFPVPGIVRCRDGWVGINTLTAQHFADACTMLEVDEFRDQMMEVVVPGPANEKFFTAIQPWLDARSTNEIVELSQAFRVPAAPVGDAASMLEFAQFKERSFFIEEDGVTYPGPPYRLSATPARRHGPAPRLGEHAARHDEVAGPTSVSSDPNLPFAGLRVVELGNFWAAPICAMYLGALGAEVVKIESTRRPDGMRFSGAVPEMGPDWYDRSGVFAATNLNKKDVAIELDRDQGREAFLGLVANADVLIENFASRVIDQFGIGYEQLRAVKPDLIMLRMPAFGLEGPWRNYVGWAMVIEQATGMASVTGPPDLPMHPGGLADPVNGMHAAVAVQAAVEHRERTGEGQLVEIAQLETGANLTAELVVEWTSRGTALERRGNRDPRFAPQGVYRSRDVDGSKTWVAATVIDDEQWRALAALIGRPDWVDAADLADLAGRQARHDEIDDAISAWTADRDPDDVVDALRAIGVPAARVLDSSQSYDDPQLASRGFFQSLPHPLSGERRYPGWPMRFSFLDAPHRFGAPTLGQHNREVLEAIGYDADKIRALEDQGVIGTRLQGA